MLRILIFLQICPALVSLPQNSHFWTNIFWQKKIFQQFSASLKFRPHSGYRPIRHHCRWVLLSRIRVTVWMLCLDCGGCSTWLICLCAGRLKSTITRPRPSVSGAVLTSDWWQKPSTMLCVHRRYLIQCCRSSRRRVRNNRKIRAWKSYDSAFRRYCVLLFCYCFCHCCYLCYYLDLALAVGCSSFSLPTQLVFFSNCASRSVLLRNVNVSKD